MRARALAFMLLTGWWIGAGAAGNPYLEMRAAAVKGCEAIDPAEYQTGLINNPDGYRSLYRRSACFQDAAVRYRDDALCVQVKERRALFFSSWGYSARRCRQLVTEGTAADRKALDEIRRQYAEGAVQLRDFRVERNGNGRDFDIIPLFDAGYAHGYALRFEIVDAEGITGSVLFAAYGTHLKGGDDVRIFVRQADIRQRYPQFQPGRPYRVRGTLTLSIGYGGQSGMWSDAFIERAFPAAERTEVLVQDVTF